MLGMVVTCATILKRSGVEAMHLGRIDKAEFLIPPVALIYFYRIFAAVFHWSTVSAQEVSPFGAITWVGVTLCLTGLLLHVGSLISFNQSFCVGGDVEHPVWFMTYSGRGRL
ncbi:MAG: hypothetical protein QM706_04725 [Nitrospira sp.]